MQDNTIETAAERDGQTLEPDEPMLVEANTDSGFNYPYYLVVPENGCDEFTREGPNSDGSEWTTRSMPVLVEPHNVGERIEDFEQHLELAKKRIDGGTGRQIAEELGSPFLIPVFPRPFEEPVDWTHMIHMLDAETMAIEDGPLARVDLQLLRMVEDARERLASAGYDVPEQIMLNGFSSQAAFVNRFAALHPERVCSVSAGGINGLVILPKERTDVRGFGERDLNYPVGIANVADFTGKPFDVETFRDVYQFLYIGEDDDKDALLFPDAWTEPELRGIAVLTYGEDIHEERFPYCREVYEEFDVNAVFRMYEGAGHTPEPAIEDIVTFHERALEGEEIDSIRSDIGGNVG